MSVSFTGHRPERLGVGYDERHPQVDLFLNNTIAVAAREHNEFISGAALGVDQWAAEHVLALGANLTLALPFATYGENWPEKSRKYLDTLVKRAKRVHIVCNGPYEPYKTHMRNQWMIRHSQVVIAVWDGEKGGGTASAVQIAKNAKKEIVRFNPKSGLIEPV